MINAEVRSEEMYTRLSIAFNTEEEKKCITNTVDTLLKKHKLNPEIHFSQISSDKTVMVIEFNEDRNREAGDVFEEIIKTLNVTCIV